MTDTTIPIITIHNIETDTVETRQMNDAEYEQYQKDQVRIAADQAAADAVVANKTAILMKLGLTEDEAKALL
jgi:hypothetical protein